MPEIHAPIELDALDCLTQTWKADIDAWKAIANDKARWSLYEKAHPYTVRRLRGR